ncbi:MAG: lamin tail domain-containing protein [Ignavibacteriales bacterium]|nr:lamin tail domain-containing protein [Ignavibacteriales bacterium]
MKKFGLLIVTILFFSSFSFSQIISQYVETNSGSVPKGIEVWNNTTSTLDFSTNNLVVRQGTNGAALATLYTISSGTLAPGAVLVIGTTDMQATAVGNGAAFYTFAFTFNGDDALALVYGGTTTDIFGTPGVDPGTAWTGGTVSTANQNIQLLSGITTGNVVGWSDPSLRFEVVSTNPAADITGFGLAPGSAAVPLLSSSVSSLNSLSYVFGNGPSTSQLYTLTGTDLDGSDVTVTAPADYEISLDDATFTSEITLTAYDGTATDIHVRLIAGLAAGTYDNEDITNAGGGSVTLNVTCNGSITGVLPNLFFSEYVEGSSNNKAVEIINISGSDVDLTAGNYVVLIYANGSSSVTNTIALTGTLLSEEVFVLANSSAGTTLLGLADQTSSSLTFNGDDALVLRVGGASGNILDVVGQIGFDPGTFWGTEQNTTLDHTLRRQNLIAIGDRNGFDVFDPATEWNTFNIDDFTDLGNPSLPVELTSFSATTIGSTVKLSWNTATEVNNYGFDVERSVVKNNWEKIGFVEGNGNSNSPKIIHLLIIK